MRVYEGLQWISGGELNWGLGFRWEGAHHTRYSLCDEGLRDERMSVPHPNLLCKLSSISKRFTSILPTIRHLIETQRELEI